VNLTAFAIPNDIGRQVLQPQDGAVFPQTTIFVLRWRLLFIGAVVAIAKHDAPVFGRDYLSPGVQREHFVDPIAE